jgi:hypothetical protein
MSVIRGNPSLQPQPVLSTDNSTPIVAPTIAPTVTPTVTSTVTSNEDLNDIFPNADLKHFLADHFNVNTLISKITKYVLKIPEIQKLKLDPELTSLLMNIIKDELKNKDADPEDVLITALTPIFNLNDSDIAILKQQIVYLENNKLLKGIPFSKKLFKSSIRYIFRKFG